MAKKHAGERPLLARNLARFRAELGLSQSKMAQAAGVPVNTWQTWEAGRREPRGGAVFRIAVALDRPSDDLNAENPPTQKKKPIPPGFALAVIDDETAPDLEKKASDFIADLNLEYRRRVTAKREQESTERGGLAQALLPKLVPPPASSSRDATQSRSRTPRRSK